MLHRKPRGRHAGRHRAPLGVPARYSLLATSVVVGAGVVALGAGAVLPADSPAALAEGAGRSDTATSRAVDPGPADGRRAAALTPVRSGSQPARASRSQTRPAAPRPRSSWIKPADGALSSRFGPRWGTMHSRVDIAAPYGAAVHAANAGVVTIAGWYGGYGYLVEVDHGNGVRTRYGHNSAVLVGVGERVEAGQQVARAGSTGDSTGPHCHFEVRLGDRAVDPIPYLAARGLDLHARVASRL